MGVYIAHHLTLDGASPADLAVIHRQLTASADAAYVFDLGPDPADRYKPNESRNPPDLTALLGRLSVAFPTVLFTLECQDEGHGSWWRHYYRNGRRQIATGDIVFAPFDPKSATRLRLGNP